MKFATAADGSPDGKLLVVSRDLTHAAPAADIVRNLLLALERWDEVEEDLRHFAERVDAGTAPDLAELHSYKLSAPLPRTWQWLDRSEENTSEIQSLMRISYAGFCLKKK